MGEQMTESSTSLSGVSTRLVANALHLLLAHASWAGDMLTA
jgi:hypothetical protein